jgi:hypothetical protein
MNYIVTIRGAIPPDLTRKVAQVHAEAILQASAQKRVARRAKAQEQV